MRRLLDSNILIYAGRPQNAFLDAWLRPATAGLSAISIPEVLGYPSLSAADEALFEAWFAALTVHPVTEPILRQAAALRRQRRMKLGDSIIAATALALDAELVTRNTGDFRHVPQLRLINPFAEPELS